MMKQILISAVCIVNHDRNKEKDQLKDPTQIVKKIVVMNTLIMKPIAPTVYL